MRAGHVVRPPGSRHDRRERDRPEQLAQEKSGLQGPLLEERPQLQAARLDPGERREPEVGRATVQFRDLGLKERHLRFGLRERLADRRTFATLGDEIHEVVKPTALGTELSRLGANLLRDIGIELGEDLLHLLVHVTNRRRIGKEPLNIAQDDPLGEIAIDPNLVVATAGTGSEAAIVAGSLAAHEPDRPATGGANHRAAEQMVRKRARATALLRGKAPATLAAGPDAANLEAARPDLGPQGVRNDPERLVLADHPLGLRLFERGAAAGMGIAAVAALVPHPAAVILLTVENAGHRAGGPPLARPDATRNPLLVQDANDPRDGFTARVEVEDAADDRGLSGVDLHVVALGPGTTRLVVADGPNGNRTITEGSLADEEATQLLTVLTTERLGLQIREKQLVEDAAELDVDLGVGIVGVDTVGHRNEPDVVELKVQDHPQHEVVVPGEPREIVNQEHLKRSTSCGLEHAFQTRPLPTGARQRLVGINVLGGNDKTTPFGLPLAGGNLIRNALGPLILAGKPGIASSKKAHHEEPSLRCGAAGEGGTEDAASGCRSQAAASKWAR